MESRLIVPEALTAPAAKRIIGRWLNVQPENPREAVEKYYLAALLAKTEAAEDLYLLAAIAVADASGDEELALNCVVKVLTLYNTAVADAA